jgi:hypothetical protein
MTVLAFALKCSTLEDMDTMVNDVFDIRNGGEEYIDGWDPFCEEACLKRQGEYQLKSIGYHILSSSSALSAGFTSSALELTSITFTLSSDPYGVGELGAGSGEEYWSVPQL